MEEFEYKGHKIKDDDGLNIDDGHASYEIILKKLNPQIEWIYEEEEDAYQGEWFAVGSDKGGNWYYHKGSYGSCSGCDWLQGISTEKEAIEFLKEMEKILPIGGTKEKAIEYLTREKPNLWDDAQTVIDYLIEKIKTKTDARKTSACPK